MEGAGPGPDEAQGPIADNFVMGHGEATEGNPLILPASPCLPPHPTSGLATEENPPRSPAVLGSPWTSPPPEFRSLSSPPGLGKRSANPLQVYSRRRSRPRGAALPESSTLAPTIELEAEVSAKSPCIPAGDVAAPAPSPAATPLNHDTFISNLSRRTAGLLPVPTISKRRAKALPPGETPRRSRRLAGAVAEFQPVDWARRSKMKVMRSLEIISEQNGVCQQAEEEYCKLFENPLPDVHLIGLAALFNWSIPEFCEDDDQVGEDLALAREILHQLEITQDSRTLSPREDWLKNNLKKHCLALASLKRTIAHLCSRIDWVRDGDANTKFFQLHARHRKRKNFIGKLVSGDQIYTKHEDKARLLVEFYEGLLGTSLDRARTINLDALGILSHDLVDLELPFTEEEMMHIWERRVHDGISDVFEDCGKESRIVITTRKTDVAALATPGYQLNLNPLDIKDALQLFFTKAFPNKTHFDWISELLECANDMMKTSEGLPLEKCPLELQELANHIVRKCEDSSVAKCPSELQDLATYTVNKFKGLSLSAFPSELQNLATLIVKQSEDLPLVKCPSELQEITIDIVKKCRGLPLAIVSVGSRLSSRKQIVPVWRQMCNELPCELEKDDQVQRIINLSYYDLPSDRRNCFVYCSLFPEDYHFSKDDLVRLWVAEGFVEKKGDSTLEEVAEGYLSELIHRNMLQLVENDELGRVNTCKMHDILRELALCISKAEIFGTVNDFGAMVQMDTDVRRISSYGWKKTKTNKSKMKFPHLRTLMASDTIVDYVPSILSESKYLTVLELQNSDFQELPTSIGNLFNLKYIGLRNTRITSLPDSIKNLCNLQTLDVKSTSIKALSPGIVKLTKLRHLLADKFADKNQSEFRYFIGVEAPEGLSNLEDLQTLETVQASMDLPEQLDMLLHLRSLWIDNITSAVLPTVEGFLLPSDENETLLLNHFNPTCMKLHKLINHGRYLKYLSLSRCHFVGDPLVVLASTVPNITYLRLNNIPSPPTLDLPEGSFPHLKTLVLKNMNDVSLLKISNGALPVIECLYITSLPKLETLPRGIKSLGSLKKLWLLDLHSNFKAQWDMAGMQKDLQHVLERRA
ncbi:unnamed protein product [Miscanthus lutarioriparius]|uniref:Uncharacterized protein n=1 Tax=Miscanthus lutarioriparius TaxID=422564 RepID=A0A811QKR9_9POAL|nr:unnamed protein product [Miscanthus lutarioriparius]